MHFIPFFFGNDSLLKLYSIDFQILKMLFMTDDSYDSYFLRGTNFP